MINKSLIKVSMPEQSPTVRSNNFSEVSLGYTLEQAQEEARRCLGCKHRPCVKGCPVNVPIPEFIEAVVAGDIEEAYRVLLSQNRLPAICGRVCPQEVQCESLCVRGKKGEPVAIGRLERFVADYVNQLPKRQERSRVTSVPKVLKKGKVAVVGSGPASLTCAGELAADGYQVTMFEALHELGGVLVYGIPEFRLPKALVKAEIDKITAMGVTVHRNVIIGQSLLLDDLFDDGYAMVFIGSGAGLPRFMGIPGEDYNGCYSANEFLTRVNLMKAYKKESFGTPIKVGSRVAVIGGGNVAMDAARTAKRLGAEQVAIIYRRSEEELPARKEEIHHAKEEGIEFKLLMNPIEIIGQDSQITAIRCQQMKLTEVGADGRRRPIPIEGAEQVLPMDTVIIAIGQTPNPLIKRAEKDLATDRRGCILVNDETQETSLANVYAGGDVVTGAATVILAMGAGKAAAAKIKERLRSLKG